MTLSLTLATLTFTKLINIPELICITLAAGLVVLRVPHGSRSSSNGRAREDLSNAIALNSSMFNGARLIGPPRRTDHRAERRRSLVS